MEQIRMMTMRLARGAFALGALMLASACSPPPPAARRAALLERAGGGGEAVETLAKGLEDENRVVRRTAVRLLTRVGEPAREALVAALENEDCVVRTVALRTLAGLPGDESVAYLAKGLEDENPLVRKEAVETLVAIEPRTGEVGGLIEAASRDSAEVVRNIAARALWPFHREVVSVRDGTDRDIRVVQTIPLPREGWRFRLDPRRDGHLQGWHEADFDDAEWDLIDIEQAWQQAGYQYTGVTWYRRTVTLPAEVEHLAVELRFEGVDESAWVWVNGEYVGQHDIGPEGWDDPFALDVTREIRWGGENRIVVRAMNTAHAGGIWKPVRFEVLK